RGKDLDEAKALEAKRKAEEALSNQSAQLDYAKAQAELSEAIAQIAAIQKLRKRN
ncbi:MAG: F0F1 ATP synthase subunit epsilon, partial [Betaproteobacteria bacterium HGW-Betaproteobacteria-19]